MLYRGHTVLTLALETIPISGHLYDQKKNKSLYSLQIKTHFSHYFSEVYMSDVNHHIPILPNL